MLYVLTFILAVYADLDATKLVILGEFPTHDQCGAVLPYLHYDGVCRTEIAATSTKSIRPKRNPIYGGL